MTEQTAVLSKTMTILFEELEQECLTAIRYIEALKASALSTSQRDELLGELSASITHLRIQTELLDAKLENLDEVDSSVS
jgi:hypothetical protein